METVLICGREFRPKTTYRPRSGKGRSRILMAAFPEIGQVEWAHTVNSTWRICGFPEWARWAGQEIAP